MAGAKDTPITGREKSGITKSSNKRKKTESDEALFAYLKESDERLLSMNTSEMNFGRLVGCEILKLPEEKKLAVMGKIINLLEEEKSSALY